MTEVHWYYARNNEQFGPVSVQELRELVESGRLGPDDLLWREGMDAWTTAIHLAGLFDEPEAAAPVTTIAPVSDRPGPQASQPLRRAMQPKPSEVRSRGLSLGWIVYLTQTLLWGLCVLVVLVGLTLFTLEVRNAENRIAEIKAAATYSTFFMAAYLLARAGEKVSLLLLRYARARSQRDRPS